MPTDPNHPFSQASIQQAVKDVADLPRNQVQLGVVKNATDQGVEIEGEKDWTLANGDTAFVAGDASYMQKAKATIAGWFGFKWK